MELVAARQSAPGRADSAASANPAVLVVVPTLAAAGTLAACLASIKSQSYACESIVVDNFSVDGTFELARAEATHAVQVGPERSAQRNFGAEACPSEIVGFIDADMRLSGDVLQQVAAAIHDGGQAVIVPEVSVGTTFWAKVKAFEKSFYPGQDNVEAARFFTTASFRQLGGFDESLDAGEDWDLTIRARRAGYAVVRIVAPITHDEGTLGYWQSCRKKAAYARGLRAFTRKHGGATLRQAMHRPYLARPWLLAREPRLGAGLILLKSGELSAVLIGAFADLWSTARMKRRLTA